MVDAFASRTGPPAADPRASVWVAASAGTGKTTVLTERLLRLMLDGTDPGHLLCLTFTRAAAAEMANRLDRELGLWATLPDGELARALGELTGGAADEAALARARRLFALVLDTPGGIKISTIHAFCQTLLRRFPLEAEVAPEFAVTEERGAAELLAEAAQRVIVAAREGRDPLLGEALTIVSDYTAEERFGELMQAIASERGKLRRAVAQGHRLLHKRLSKAFDLPGELTLGVLVADFCAVAAGDEAGLAVCAAFLGQGSPNDRKFGKVLAAWCEAPERRASLLDAYLGAYLNDKREIKQRNLVTKDTARAALAAGYDANAVLTAEAQRVHRFEKARAALVVREATCALVRLGERLLAEYDAAKRRKGILDFDDLVGRALDLLQRPGVAPWVLFKLDGGLDHILIDEAQDTNPEQWQIVAALAEEFFAGEGARGTVRTVFAVGDTKQSIFSFQHADPQAFLDMRRHFQERVNAAHQPWIELPLDISFRSTEPILRAVDAIFGRPETRDGVALDGHHIRHVAQRTGEAGLVELWPPVGPSEEQAEDDGLPVAYKRVAEPHARLARAVAARVAHWLSTGERLPARDRPIRPGDIMVLVRRRNEFVSELLRALKQRGVPVAGADRLVLTDQLAVQDLVALGRFLLLPEDDLTLAAVLKSPLFDIDEDMLFDLCYARDEQTLWNRLRIRAQSSARLRYAMDRLSAWLARADFVPPYELYAEILGGEGGRRALVRRLGPEAEDPVEQFLEAALAYERDHVPSLQGFLRWLTAAETEVKRDLAAHSRDEVRILTVHGAKGLEAPVVFLPDTIAVPDQRVALLWSRPDGLPLWKPPGDHAAAFYLAAKAEWRQSQLQEYRRLLYVALTRAQDRLYICGWRTRKPQDLCWHTLCRAGLSSCAQTFDFDTRPLIGHVEGWSGEGLRLERMQDLAIPPRREPHPAAVAVEGALPSWAVSPASEEPDPPRPLYPSRPAGEEPPPLSPLNAAGRERFRRGLIVHRLLQSLPGLPALERDRAARRFLALPTHGLPVEEQDDIRRETLAVIDDPGLAKLFGPQSQAEVPVVGLVGGHVLSGQIDRLVVAEREVLIVDYKTLRPVPVSEAEVAPVYLRQLAIYRQALARIYPKHDIRCVLLWTQVPLLMPISRERLAAHAP